MLPRYNIEGLKAEFQWFQCDMESSAGFGDNTFMSAQHKCVIITKNLHEKTKQIILDFRDK